MNNDTYKYYKIWNKHHPNDPITIGDGYCIHHKDGDHSNNDPDNLQKMKFGDHSSFHNKINKRGFKHSKETKEKMSKAQKGKIVSEETRKKISEGNKGKIVFFSTEHRQKISKANKLDKNGRSKLTLKTVKWIRDILNSDEYRNKLITQKQIGNLFGVSQAVISSIKINKSWKVESNDAHIG